MADETAIEQPLVQEPPEQTPPPGGVQNPYSQKVYAALKDNLQGFNKSPDEFNKAMQNPAYAARAYQALKENLNGFTKTPDEFYSAIGVQKKSPIGTTGSQTSALPPGVSSQGIGYNAPQQPFLAPQQPNQPAQPPVQISALPAKYSQADDRSLQYGTTRGQVADGRLGEDLAAHQQLVNSLQQTYSSNLQPKVKEMYDAMSPEDQQKFATSAQFSPTRLNELQNLTPKDMEHWQFMNTTPTGKVLGWTGTNIVRPITKTGGQIIKGAATLANGAFGNTSSQVATDALEPYLDKATNVGLTPEDIKNVQHNNGAISNGIQMVSQIAPLVAGGEAAGIPKTIFALQGLGQGQETVDDLEKSGVQVNPLAKGLIMGGTSLTNSLMMGEYGEGILGKLGSRYGSKIVDDVTAQSLQEAAAKGLTNDELTQTIAKNVKNWTVDFKNAPMKVLNKTLENAATLTKFDLANYATKVAANAVSDKPVFDTSGSQLMSDVGTSLQQAPMLGALGTFSESQLAPHTELNDDVTKAIFQDPTKSQDIKAQISQYGASKGWTQEQIDATGDHIDRIANIAKTLPKNIPSAKLTDAIDIVQGRNDMQAELAKEQQNRSQLDPALSTQPTDYENYLQNKIDQANDKLRGFVTGNKATYSKGTEANGEDGQFFKTVNGGKEEITPDRYELENLEREGKKQPIVEQKGENTDAIQEQTTGEMGVREQGAVGEGVGGQNEPVETPQQSEQQPNGSSENAPTEESKISVKEVIGKPITYRGEDATLEQDGQTLVAKIKNSNREYELGNVDEIGDKSIKDLGIEHQNSVVDTNDAGNITVRGKEYVNNYSDPLAAINRDKDGNVVSVNLETPDGEKRAFRGDVAEDIAYQLHLKELNKDNETAGKFEQFAGEHEPTQQSIVAAEDANTAEKATVADNAEVSRKPAREAPKVIEVKPPPIEVPTQQIEPNETTTEKSTGTEVKAAGTENISSDDAEQNKEQREEEIEPGEVKKTILTKRAYEGEIQPEVKKYLEDKGLTRASFSQEERSKQATDFINKFGEEAAQHAVENGDVDGGMAASILAQLQVRNNRAMAEFPEGSDERDALAKKQADLIATMEKKGYLGGEFNGQLAHEYQNAELDYANVKKQVEDATGKKLTAAQDKKIKDLTDLNTKLKAQLDESEAKLIEASDREFKQDVVKKETNAEKSKRIATKLRSLKINTVNDATLGIPVALYNGAIETTASLIEGGGKIADAIDKGLEHIRDSDWYKNLSASKQQQTEQDFKNKISDASGSTDLVDLQERFVNKTDNKFSPDEARAIWGYLRKTYIDNGIPYKDAISKTSDDLGLSWRQVSDAVTSPKLKRASDEMWKKQADLARNSAGIKNWIGDQNKSAFGKALQKISGLFRGVAVFGHGGIFVGTHAGMTLFNPSTWNKVIPAFFRGWKFAYGNAGDYERSLEELKNSPNYLTAQRAGLKNNPDRINSEEYQRSQHFLGKLGLAGEKGFNAIKVLRQDLFDYHFNKLTPAERDDPAVAKSIAHIVNLATGATNLKIPAWVNEVSFAGGMEASRWEKLTASPVEATKTALNAILNPSKASTADKVFAKVWARRVGEQLATFTGALLANSALQNQINPKNPVNITNPDKPDFLKFKVDNVTIDPTSGMRSTADFIYKLGKIPFESKKELHGDKRIGVAGEKLAEYGRGKLAPLYGTVADVFSGQDYSGNVVPWSNDKPSQYNHKLTPVEYGSSKLPLPVAEAIGVYYKSALDHGAHKKTLIDVLKGFGSGFASGTTGVRVGEYDANAPENKKKK